MPALELVELAGDAVVDRLGRARQVVLDMRDDDTDAFEGLPSSLRRDQSGEYGQLLEDVTRAEMPEERVNGPVAGIRASNRSDCYGLTGLRTR